MKAYKYFIIAALVIGGYSLLPLFRGQPKTAATLAAVAFCCVGLAYIPWKWRDMKRKAWLDIAVQRALDTAAARDQRGFDRTEAFHHFQKLAGKNCVYHETDVRVLHDSLVRSAEFAQEHGCAPSASRPGQGIYPRIRES